MNWHNVFVADQKSEDLDCDVVSQKYAAVGEGLNASRAYLFQRLLDILADFVEHVNLKTISVSAAF